MQQQQVNSRKIKEDKNMLNTEKIAQGELNHKNMTPEEFWEYHGTPENTDELEDIDFINEN